MESVEVLPVVTTEVPMVSRNAKLTWVRRSAPRLMLFIRNRVSKRDSYQGVVGLQVVDLTTDVEAEEVMVRPDRRRHRAVVPICHAQIVE